MRTIPDDKMARLPRWAQDEIVSLERQIEDLTDQVATFGGAKSTGVMVSNYKTDLNVPQNWHASFRVGKMTLRVTLRDGYLRIDSDRGLAVRPGGGVNVVEVLPWER